MGARGKGAGFVGTGLELCEGKFVGTGLELRQRRFIYVGVGCKDDGFGFGLT